jgi:hypothetical protein
MFDLQPARFQEVRKFSDGDTVDAGRSLVAQHRTQRRFCVVGIADCLHQIGGWRRAFEFGHRRGHFDLSHGGLSDRRRRPNQWADAIATLTDCLDTSYRLPICRADSDGLTFYLQGGILLYPVTVTGYRAPCPDADLTSAERMHASRETQGRGGGQVASRNPLSPGRQKPCQMVGD